MASRCAAFPLRIVHGLVTEIMSSRAVLRCSATYFDFCPVLSGPGLVGSFPTNHDGLRRVTSCPEIKWQTFSFGGVGPRFGRRCVEASCGCGT